MPWARQFFEDLEAARVRGALDRPARHRATSRQAARRGFRPATTRALPPLAEVRVGPRLRSLDPLLVAFELAVPPLGLQAAGALGGAGGQCAAVARGSVVGLVVVPWIVPFVSVPLCVLIGVISSGAPRSTYRALLRAPLFVLAKPLSLGRTLGFRGDTWVRTERTSDSRP
jgi:hypothetical protein